MSILQDAKKLLEALSPGERAQLLEWAIHDLTDTHPGIAMTAGGGGLPALPEPVSQSGF